MRKYHIPYTKKQAFTHPSLYMAAGLCAAFCLSLAPARTAFAEETAAPSRGVTINVYNWGEYIANGTDDSLDINEEFTRRTGIQVNYTTFDSNEALYSKLAGGGADDLALQSFLLILKFSVLYKFFYPLIIVLFFLNYYYLVVHLL